MPVQETFLGVRFAEDSMKNLVNNFKFIVEPFSTVIETKAVVKKKKS